MRASPETAREPHGPLESGRRHAWKLLLGLAVVVGLFGIGDLILGIDADPAIAIAVTGLTPDEIREASEPLARLIDLQIAAGAAQLTVLGVLWSVIVLIPYRRKELWAWYTMWTFPAWSASVAIAFLLVDLHPNTPPPPPAISGWVFFGLSSLPLLVTRGDFSAHSDV